MSWYEPTLKEMERYNWLVEMLNLAWPLAVQMEDEALLKMVIELAAEDDLRGMVLVYSGFFTKAMELLDRGTESEKGVWMEKFMKASREFDPGDGASWTKPTKGD